MISIPSHGHCLSDELYTDWFDKLTFSDNLYWILASVFLIGIGSSVLHPEASRITFLASGGKRGLAQSLFQVGGNFGGSLGPLLVALLVAPYGRQHLIVFAFVALAAIGVMYPICKWYKSYLNRMKAQTVRLENLFIFLCLWKDSPFNRDIADSDFLQIYLYGKSHELLYFLFDS